MKTMKKNWFLVPVLLSFFVMGSLDLVGVATNYFKADLGLSDSQAGFIPGLMSVWFLLISIPTGRLMGSFGRKNTVMVALGVICLSLIAALFKETFASMLIAMALLGIGDTMLVVALNPLVASLVADHKLASTLTAGECAKSLAGLIAPMIAAWGALHLAGWMGIGWRVIFLIFLAVSLITALLMFFTKMEERSDAPAVAGSCCGGVAAPGHSHSEEEPGHVHTEEHKAATTTLAECFRMLGRPAILLAFIALLCHVGSDVGISIIIPEMFVQRLAMTLEEASFALTVYFIFRMAGSLAGIYILQKISIRSGLLACVAMLAAAVLLAFVGHSPAALYASVALFGLGNSVVCTLIISQALLTYPAEQNTTSAIMTMGLAGGALFPLLMGFASDRFGLAGAITIVAICTAYILYFSLWIKKH